LSLEEKVHGDKNGILFTIEDNGEGIPADIKSRVLEPFFTTKPTGHGAGLGLPISRTIVTEHNGVLAISDSETLGGAKISVWLPEFLEANADV
jgi:signal transduction histidine kinase